MRTYEVTHITPLTIGRAYGLMAISFAIAVGVLRLLVLLFFAPERSAAVLLDAILTRSWRRPSLAW